jgi:hypothetical protein
MHGRTRESALLQLVAWRHASGRSPEGVMRFASRPTDICFPALKFKIFLQKTENVKTENRV